MEEAEASQRRALAFYRGLFGPRNAETLRVQRELAQTLWLNAKLGEAESLLRGVLTSLEDAERETSPYALETSSYLGYVLFLQARYDEAIAILRPTLARQRRIFGETNAPSLYTIRFLGSALRDRGELEETEALYRDGLRISRALYGEDHSETYYSTIVLASVLERKGELEEAESLARHALVLAQGNFGPDHFTTSGSELARILLDRGEWVEAEQQLRHALTTTRRSLPAGHPDEGDLLNRLAFLLADRGAADADAFYREAVAFNDARRGEPVFVTDGLHFLASARHRSGDLAGAEANYRSALGVYRRQLPNGHAYRAASATGLGAVLLDAGRPGDAERYLREGLAQWQAHSPPDPDRLAEARALLARAVEQRSATTGS
jgi:tetratricopeptide (TPR) repeat protein